MRGVRPPRDGAPRILPPLPAVDWLGWQQVIAEVAGAGAAGFDAALGTDQYGLDVGPTAESSGNCERGHEVATGAAARDEDRRPFIPGAGARGSLPRARYSAESRPDQ